MDFANRFLAPAVVTLLLFLVFVLAYVLARRGQGLGAQFDETDAAASGDEEEVDEDDYVGVNEETVRSFPKFTYSRREEFVHGETAMEEEEGNIGGACWICLLEYEETDVIRMFPVCNHFFHQSCVDKWLKLRSTCPVCRISLLRSNRIAAFA